MTRATVYVLVLVAVVGGGLGAAQRTAADNQKTLAVAGVVSPSEWRDALDVYTQPWSVRVAVRYGNEVYAEWSGSTDHAGAFRAPMHQDGDRPGACIEVVVSGAFLYGDQRVEVWMDEEQPTESTIDVGTIVMQRRR
jgi:hypothetical protein